MGVGVVMTEDDDAMPAEAREIVVGDEPERWGRLGFAVRADGSFAVGGIRVVAAGEGALRMGAEGLAEERPDGLPIESVELAGVPPSPHPNGAVGVDHVVAFTDSMPRTLAALDRAGLDLRRRRDPPEAPAPQAFLRFGPLILEVVETGEGPPRLWGVVVVVADLDAAAERLGALLGGPRAAVQPGRRIATVRREAGLSAPLALMTPRPQPARGR